MTITWKKLGDTWAVQSSQKQEIGAVVTVVNRKNEAKTVTLGECLGGNDWGYFYAVAQAPKAPAPQAQAVGDLSGVLALFAKAKTHLRFPAIILAVPDADLAVRLTLAGPKAKVPGSVTVCENERNGTNDYGEPTREWLGRVTVEGTYEPARKANGRAEAIALRLRELAQDPAKVAAEHGRLTGRCCFCNAHLGGNSPDSPTGRKSLAVGYGQTCASHYGLPWGEEKFSFQAEEV